MSASGSVTILSTCLSILDAYEDGRALTISRGFSATSSVKRWKPGEVWLAGSAQNRGIPVPRKNARSPSPRLLWPGDGVAPHRPATRYTLQQNLPQCRLSGYLPAGGFQVPPRPPWSRLQESSQPWIRRSSAGCLRRYGVARSTPRHPKGRDV